MKVTVGRSSEKFAADLEQLKKDSADQIRRSFDSIVTLKDFLSEIADTSHAASGAKLILKLDSVEKKLSRFEDSLNDRVARLIREYDKLKLEVDNLAREKKLYKTLYDLSSLVALNKEIKEILPEIIQSVAEILSCDHVLLQVVDDDGKIYQQFNSSTKAGVVGKFTPSKQISDAVLNTGDPVMIESLSDSDQGCSLCVPLKSDEDVTGLLYAFRLKSSFSKNDMEFLKILSERIWQLIEPSLISPAAPSMETVLMEDLREKCYFDEIVANSPEMAHVLSIVADVAESESAVLIEGESGTGKELLARALHFNSRRKDNPFVTINCAAIPETLLESELFGYEKGAFTGAVARKPGKFEQANGGTVFLDEIGELPPLLQVKLLRFLQSHEFEPLGSTSVKLADVRIISATKKDLGKMVETAEFRDDLFYRINVIAIQLPPLVQRTGEVELLADHFIKKYAAKNNKTIRGIDQAAMAYLKVYNFPGNVRELENIIERAVVLCKGEILTVNELPDSVRRKNIEKGEPPSTIKELNELKHKLWREIISPLETEFALRLLEKGDRNISEAARLGGLHRKQLQRILKRNKLNAEFKADKENNR
jgi:transcriptional regulator with GAF, ATPase, and Fis domain